MGDATKLPVPSFKVTFLTDWRGDMRKQFFITLMESKPGTALVLKGQGQPEDAGMCQCFSVVPSVGHTSDLGASAPGS